MVTSRKRVTKKTTSSRTAQLEEKLDDLVSILRATQAANANSDVNQHQHDEHQQQHQHQQQQLQQHDQHQPRNTLPQINSYNNPAGFTSRLDSLATAATSSTPGSHSSTLHHGFSSSDTTTHTPLDKASSNINDTSQLPEPTPAEAEKYLAKFRDWLIHFPFMILPQDMTAAALREERPFLWLCIMNVTSMSVFQQLKLKDRVRQEIATRIVINHEKSMDVLLGIIVSLAWATMNSGPGNKPFIITYSQIAKSIIYEMSLTRAPIEEQYFTVCFKLYGGRPAPPRLRSSEERRAVVSLWFLTSITSSFIGKLDGLRWTSHMDECLAVLEREKEHPSDETLVALVRYQLVCDEAHKLMVQDVMGEVSKTPTYIFRKGLLARLQQVRDSIPASLPAHAMLQIHSLAAEVQIDSVGLFVLGIPTMQRTESMYSCLKAVRELYDMFLRIPPEDLAGYPFALYIVLAQIQIALYRLTTAEDPAWDKELLRSTADLRHLLEMTIEKFNKIETAYPIKFTPGEDTVFMKAAKIIGNVRTSWEPALSRYLGGAPATDNQNELAMGRREELARTGQTPMPISDPNFVDLGDMAWMTDIFGPWEY